MNYSLALLEFSSVAVGMLAVDRMLKKSPVSLLRCGTVHPGRYLALVGGTVAATEEAFTEGCDLGNQKSVLVDKVMLADPHTALVAAVGGQRTSPQGDTVGILEMDRSPAMLRLLDEVLKAVPVNLVELRLADDLGGAALAVLDGDLFDVQEVAKRAEAIGSDVCAVAVMSRVDDTLRQVLTEGTRFADCSTVEPAGAEKVED